MAVSDDLNRLAAQDVVYLVRSIGTTELLRGRLHQALDGTWVFNTSTGQNGVVGVNLGAVSSPNWTSSESPTTGIVVRTFITLFLNPADPHLPLTENIVLTNVIPAEFTE